MILAMILAIALPALGLVYVAVAMAFSRHGVAIYFCHVSTPWRAAIEREDWDACDFYVRECDRFDLWWKPFNPLKWLRWNEKFGDQLFMAAAEEGMAN